MIQVLDWLYENELRAYPLSESGIKTSTNGLYTVANDVILDAQFVLYNDENNFRKIERIVNSNDTEVLFHIRFNNNSLHIVTIPKSISSHYYYRNNNGFLMVFGLGINNIPIGNFFFDSVFFEPSVVFTYRNDWKGVTSLKFKEDGDELTGELTFLEGYQFDILPTTDTNFRLSVGNLYGTPIGCETFSDYPDDCSDIISSINGIGPDGKNELHIKAGDGIVVWDDPENHRIYVGFSFTSENDICKDIPPFPI